MARSSVSSPRPGSAKSSDGNPISLAGSIPVAPGRFGEAGWESRDPTAANAVMGELAGKGAKQARRRIVELLTGSGELRGEPQPVRHPVKFYENGDRPLEVIASRQWFVKTLDFREALVTRGRELR